MSDPDVVFALIILALACLVAGLPDWLLGWIARLIRSRPPRR